MALAALSFAAPQTTRAQPLPTPEQQAQEKAREEQKKAQENYEQKVKITRMMLRHAGLEDTDLQDTIIEFLTEQGAARQPVRDQYWAFRNSLRKPLLSDAQVAALLAEYRASVARAKEDYAKALQGLDAKIGYSKNPRLEAVLVQEGIIGDEEGFRYGPAFFGLHPRPAKAAVPEPR